MKKSHEYYFEYWSERAQKWMFEKGTITDEPAQEFFIKHMKEFNLLFCRNAKLDGEVVNLQNEKR